MNENTANQDDLRKDNSLIGAPGVHYVAYKLTERGMLALPTVRNTPGTDVIVTSRDGRHHANIQVKTSHYQRAKFWIICSAKKFGDLPFSEHDFYVLLRPRREDDTGIQDEYVGFMLTAAEAKREMQAHLDYWRKERGQEPKFSLCIYIEKGVREEEWNLPDLKKEWRKRWQEWRVEDGARHFTC